MILTSLPKPKPIIITLECSMCTNIWTSTHVDAACPNCGEPDPTILYDSLGVIQRDEDGNILGYEEQA